MHGQFCHRFNRTRSPIHVRQQSLPHLHHRSYLLNRRHFTQRPPSLLCRNDRRPAPCTQIQQRLRCKFGINASGPQRIVHRPQHGAVRRQCRRKSYRQVSRDQNFAVEARTLRSFPRPIGLRHRLNRRLDPHGPESAHQNFSFLFPVQHELNLAGTNHPTPVSNRTER